MAFVFGSFAKGFETEESDFDIAVYLSEVYKLFVRMKL
ncbi:nucleotidyltransferase domain-containing protein [Candidatus Aerophobetes bacterium]|nr:nucleotidyltransferase domain-containing protein [Candidatus Aerophobetes bacterium]